MSIEENYVNRQESENADRAGRLRWMPDPNNFRL